LLITDGKLPIKKLTRSQIIFRERTSPPSELVPMGELNKRNEETTALSSVVHGGHGLRVIKRKTLLLAEKKRQERAVIAVRLETCQ